MVRSAKGRQGKPRGFWRGAMVWERSGTQPDRDVREAGLLQRFVTGLVWGGVVASLGLAVISQVAPRPVVPPLDASAKTDAGAAALDDATVAGEAEESGQKPAVVVAGDEADAPPAVTVARPADAPAEPVASKAISPEMAGTETPATEAVPATMTEAEPVPPLADKVVAATPAPAASAPADAPETPATEPASAPAPKPDATEQAPTQPAPAQVTADSAPPAALSASDPAKDRAAESAPPAIPKADVAPSVGVTPPAMASDDAPLLAPAAKAAAPGPLAGAEPAPPVDAPVQNPPNLVMPESDPGLPGKIALSLPEAQPESSSLPQIGAAPEAKTAEQPLPETTLIDDLPPIAAFARPFENTDGKPLFAILLVDDGRADLDRASLAALPFPVTFVVDPQAANATTAAAIYRAGLQEVVMVATGLPDGTETSDLERSFEANAITLPETVAVIDSGPQGRLEDRTTAAAVVPILQDQGRGLITYDVGLNAADQAARRAALPTVALFRVLDAEGESQSTIRRYLDRAAFKAAQEGKVVVIGSTRPETVAAILEWTVEGRAASVALAPVTAALTAP